MAHNQPEETTQSVTGRKRERERENVKYSDCIIQRNDASKFANPAELKICLIREVFYSCHSPCRVCITKKSIWHSSLKVNHFKYIMFVLMFRDLGFNPNV